MPEPHDELRTLAEQIAACDDEDVIASGEDVAALYRREREAAMVTASIRSIESGAVYEAVDLGEHPAVLACVERMRDRLRALVAWARETGRMP